MNRVDLAHPLAQIQTEALVEVSAGVGADGFVVPRAVQVGARALGFGAKVAASTAFKVIAWPVGAAAMVYDGVDGYRGATAAGAGTGQAIFEGGVNAISQGAYNYSRDR